MKRYFHGIWLATLLCCGNIAAQSRYNFKSFSFKEGLSTYNIFKTIQDSFGFIWIATQDGMFRYNGRSFDIIKNSTGITNAPIGNAFTDVFAGADQKIYLADFNTGIDIIDPFDLQVTQIQSSSRYSGQSVFPHYGFEKCALDSNHNLWAAGAGFLAVKPAGQAAFVLLKNLDNINGFLTTSFIKPVSRLYTAIGVPGTGILFYNTTTLAIEGRISYEDLDDKKPTHIRDMCFDKDTLYLLTDQAIYKGVLQGTKWKAFHRYSHPSFTQLVGSSLVSDHNNRLWVGTNHGLVCISKATGAFEFIKASENNSSSLKDNNLNHLFIDNQENLWISSSKMLQMLRLADPAFTAYTGDDSTPMDHIYTLMPGSKNMVYATGTNGLFLTDLQGHSTKKIKGSSAWGVIHHLEQVDDDFWIVSTDQGMLGYKPSAEWLSRQLLTSRFPEWAGWQQHFFNAAYRYKNIFYWASEEDEGLVKWDMHSGLIKRFRAGDLNSGGIAENHIRNLKADRDNKLWLLSDNTASRFDMDMDSVIQVLGFADPLNRPRAGLFSDMYDDGNSWWFCTYGGGVNGYHKKTGKWSYITEENGLSNNCVYSILPENDSIFWVSTNRGISRVQPNRAFCTNYFFEDGLQDNSFDEKSVLKLNNHLLFGGINGFTVIDPQRLQLTAAAFPVYIHRIEYYKDGRKTVLNKLEWQQVTLPAGTNAVTLHLSALSYAAGHKIRFGYLIEGIQKEYVEVGDNNAIVLNALTHGSYTISIRYQQEDGSFASKHLQLQLTILPLWHQTWWFRLLLLLLATGAIFLLYRMRINQLKKEQAIRTKLASDLHDDLGSTLNSVKVYANLALLETQKEKHLVKIKETIQEAITGVRDMIWVLDDKKDTIPDIFTRISQFANPVCEANGIQFKQLIDDDAREYKLGREEKRNLYMMLKEAVNNAIKYAGASTISIRVELTKGKPELTVIDDGKGFDTGKTAEGNGLKNMQQRAQQIHYNLRIASTVNGGTSICLQKN